MTDLSGTDIFVLSRGRFVSKEGKLFFYNKDGFFLDNVAAHVHRLEIMAPIIRKGDDQFEGASNYTFTFCSNNVKPMELLRGNRSLRSFLAFSENIRAAVSSIKKCDIVYAMGPSFSSYCTACLGWLLKRKVLVYSGIDWRLKNRGNRLLRKLAMIFESYMLRKAQMVFVTGQELIKIYRDLRVSRVVATYPVINNIEHFCDTGMDTCDGEDIKILCVGNICYRKGQDVLAKAFRNITEKHHLSKSFSLHFVGAGDWKKLKQVAFEVFGLPYDKVTFHGYIADTKELGSIYKAADILVVPSRQEGFPRVIYEAMLAHLPIITTPVGGVSYLLKAEEHCLFFDFDDDVGLADCILRMVEEKQMRMKIIENNDRLVKEVLKKSPAQQLLEAIERL